MKFWLRLRRLTASHTFVLGLSWLLPSGMLAQDASQAPATAQDTLEQFVAEVSDFSANFVEVIYDADGQLIEESSGRFSLLRPGRFLWHYHEPEEFIVVADGEWLWTYDVEWEQATRAPLELDGSPAMALLSEGNLGDGFDVDDAPTVDGQNWVELKPHEPNPDFEVARIAFDDGVPESLELLTGLSELTRIDFDQVEINMGLPREAFDFEPPPGVHVGGLGND